MISTTMDVSFVISTPLVLRLQVSSFFLQFGRVCVTAIQRFGEAWSSGERFTASLSFFKVFQQ
jgi:hypothetical protein